MAGSARYTAVLDANVLYPNLLRDLLLSLAEAGLFHARWTNKINNEWAVNLVKNKPETAPRIEQLMRLVNQSVPDCLVENYEYLIDSLSLPDPDDRHVLAAAIVGHADAIVTNNLKDFPTEYINQQHSIEVQHPDDFLLNQLQLRPFEALEVLKSIRARLKKPVYSAQEFVDLIERSGLPQTGQYLQMQVGLL